MVNVSIDLGEAQVVFLERLLGTGQYRSRSEAVRDIIRRFEFEREWEASLAETRDKMLSVAVIASSLKKSAPRLSKRFSRVL